MMRGGETRMDAPPFRIAGLDHLNLLVDDMDAALGFYQGVLGCALAARHEQWAMAELQAGASGIALVDVSRPEGRWARPEWPGGRNLDHFCLAIDAEEAALRAHLAGHGVEIVEEDRHATADGERLSLYVRDPAGNTVELAVRSAQR